MALAVCLASAVPDLYADTFLLARQSEYRVIDEETVEVANRRGVYVCRLHGAVSFISREPMPYDRREAAAYLDWLLSQGPISVTVVKPSPVSFDECKLEVAGIRVNLRMIEEGYLHAREHRLDSSERSEFLQAEETARNNYKGFWAREGFYAAH